jgi:hypothetical protein
MLIRIIAMSVLLSGCFTNGSKESIGKQTTDRIALSLDAVANLEKFAEKIESSTQKSPSDAKKIIDEALLLIKGVQQEVEGLKNFLDVQINEYSSFVSSKDSQLSQTIENFKSARSRIVPELEARVKIIETTCLDVVEQMFGRNLEKEYRVRIQQARSFIDNADKIAFEKDSLERKKQGLPIYKIAAFLSAIQMDSFLELLDTNVTDKILENGNGGVGRLVGRLWGAATFKIEKNRVSLSDLKRTVMGNIKPLAVATQKVIDAASVQKDISKIGIEVTENKDNEGVFSSYSSSTAQNRIDVFNPDVLTSVLPELYSFARGVFYDYWSEKIKINGTTIKNFMETAKTPEEKALVSNIQKLFSDQQSLHYQYNDKQDWTTAGALKKGALNVYLSSIISEIIKPTILEQKKTQIDWEMLASEPSFSDTYSSVVSTQALRLDTSSALISQTINTSWLGGLRFSDISFGLLILEDSFNPGISTVISKKVENLFGELQFGYETKERSYRCLGKVGFLNDFISPIVQVSHFQHQNHFYTGFECTQQFENKSTCSGMMVLDTKGRLIPNFQSKIVLGGSINVTLKVEGFKGCDCCVEFKK